MTNSVLGASTDFGDPQRQAADFSRSGFADMSISGFLDGSPVAMFVIDMDHVVTHFNNACAVTIGVKAEDVIGTKTLGRIFYGHDRPLMADLIVDGSVSKNLDRLYLDKYRRSPIIPDAYEAEGFFPGFGEQGRWLFFTAAPLRNSRGQIVGAIETLRDISDRKQAEKELLKAQAALNRRLTIAQDQLMKSGKLASIGQLAAGLAHEINNPIGYISSNFGTLEKYLASLFEMLTAYQEAEPSHGAAQTISNLKNLREKIELEFLKEDIPVLMRESREGIVKVQKIVKDLKGLSHVDASPEWQYADLAQCIDSTLNVVNNQIRHKADVVKKYGDLPEILCLAPEINQVIMNLVVNAADAIGHGRGRITIRTGTQGRNVWIEVADTGSGIPKESLARIFDPFYTTKPLGKGTGLGLSVSYGIVQKHHGHIDVRTAIGVGTKFRVTLPIEQPSGETTIQALLA